MSRAIWCRESCFGEPVSFKESEMIDAYRTRSHGVDRSEAANEVSPKPRIQLKAVWVPIQHWRWLRDTAAAHRNTMQAELALLLTQAAEEAASRSPSPVDTERDGEGGGESEKTGTASAAR
jgi:hypothetical protein